MRFRKANVIYIEDFYRNFGDPFADQANGGSIKGMLEAVDLIENIAAPDTTLVPGHGTLVKKSDLLAYRAMPVDILAKVTTLREQGKSLKDILAANVTEPYDKVTLGDTQQSKDRFITEVYDEVRDFPPVIDGKRAMPRMAAAKRGDSAARARRCDLHRGSRRYGRTNQTESSSSHIRHVSHVSADVMIASLISRTVPYFSCRSPHGRLGTP